MNTDIISLSAIGYSNYNLTIDGHLYKVIPIAKEIKQDKNHRFYIINDNGKGKRITLKELYRQAFNKEYSIDNTINLDSEVWIQIENSSKYFVSNCGRVKSYCGYYAIILKQEKTKDGYLLVKINGKNVSVHKLVAAAFCENKYTDQKTEVHHTDLNRNNNNANNLEILTPQEHRKRHRKKEC